MTHAARALLTGLALVAAGFSPLLREEPNVREGNARLEAGDAAGALPRYDAAARAAGPRAEIDHDRGVALYRQGRMAEARDAWLRARERAPSPLASRASQNLGNALAALDDLEGAREAFVEALRRDPRNEDARFDLEVLLRRKEKEQRHERGQQQAERRGAQERQQQEGSGNEEKSAREAARTPEPRPGDPGPSQGAARGESDRRAEEARDRAAAGQPAGRVSRREAERMLDALRSRERVLPHAAPRRRSFWRPRDDRDW
jgi:Ca-activated chloride channel family protein